MIYYIWTSIRHCTYWNGYQNVNLTRMVYFAVQMEFLKQNLNGGVLACFCGALCINKNYDDFDEYLILHRFPIRTPNYSEKE